MKNALQLICGTNGSRRWANNLFVYAPKRERTFSRASSDTGPLAENDALQASYNFWIMGILSGGQTRYFC